VIYGQGDLFTRFGRESNAGPAWREEVTVRIDIGVQPQKTRKKLLETVRNSTREERGKPRNESHKAGGYLYNEEHEKQGNSQDAP
jgi:hypothetical protein